MAQTDSRYDPKAMAEQLYIAYRYYEEARKYQSQNLVWLGLNSALVAVSTGLFLVKRAVAFTEGSNSIATILCAIPSLLGILLCWAWWMSRQRNERLLQGLYSATIDWYSKAAETPPFLFEAEQNRYSFGAASMFRQIWPFTIFVVAYFHAIVVVFGAFLSLGKGMIAP